MARRKKGNIVNGWINLDKPAEMTSTQAVGRVRRILNAQKAGHAGTLDPLATGILPIALGEATKTIPYCQDALKSYAFTVRWGEARDTDDAEGDIVATSDVRPAPADIEAALPAFIGDIEQLPPKFSALKINGERAYDLAREGEEVILQPRPVYIESLELLSTETDEAHFRCICGKGTYIRSIARDLGEKLGTCGYITALRREFVGPFDLNNAISLEKLEELGDSAAPETALLPVETALDDIPALAIREQEAAQLKQGRTLSFISRPDLERIKSAGIDVREDCEALVTYQGKPIALVMVCGPEISPVRVFNL
ncbi:MAG: tRNA pseudouridine(55) synthase TruB [Rhodospirillales bacterium]|nr:tRNA pseudouridine(55) synthase TruB [Rhodospirillales bacterium]